MHRRPRRPSTPAGERLQYLRALGVRGPDTVLGAVAMSIGQALRQADEAADGDGAIPHPIQGDDGPVVALRRDLIGVMRRSLDREDASVSPLTSWAHHNEHLVAYGAVTLMADAPREMARLLAERIRSHPQLPIPTAWRDELVRDPREKSLNTAADALEATIGTADTAGSDPAQTERAALDLLRLLRGEEAA